MRISVANVSTTIKDEEFRTVVEAVGRQVGQDFAPLWGMVAEVRAVAMQRDHKPNPELDLSDVVLYVGELDDDPRKVTDAVGYHDLNHTGVAFGFVFTDIAARMGEAWSVTLSHEVLELIADPDVNLLVVGPHPNDPGQLVLRKYEICDPVQADTYQVGGVSVSNFVTPHYFAKLPTATTTRTNYLNVPLDRFGVRPGGYFSYFDLEARQWSDCQGPGAETRNNAKAMLGEARRVVRHRGTELARGTGRPAHMAGPGRPAVARRLRRAQDGRS
jgi:hypothetical protein